MRRGDFAFAVLLAVVVLGSTARGYSAEHVDDDEDFTDRTRRFVSCGSVVKLRHGSTGARLHSHEVNYGSGSKQQSVTGLRIKGDTNSLWQIMAANGKDCASGYVVCVV